MIWPRYSETPTFSSTKPSLTIWWGTTSTSWPNGVSSGPIAPCSADLFDLTSIQRNLKAAGRFVYIDRVKGNPKFLADVPRVLSYVKRNLETYPELNTLRKHLSPHVPELQ